MKILRIQFKNLNSLPVGDIDLENGPLAHAGIFAITGPTGAGKSTILDAITLALYGRAARYDSAANPEDMMSRHTASCHAEVLFEVRGERYRAEWQLRRARNRIDGKVQPANRRLYRSLPGGDEPLAQNTREADTLVEELIGLNYDRFLRSALLAQGQFARFLKATENERAELLESLTATTIYSGLSTLAFREASDREAALEQRRAALGSQLPLDEEARRSKTEEIATRKTALDTLHAEQEAATRLHHRGQQRQDLRKAETTLSERQAALARQRDEAAPTFKKLEIHRQAAPYIPGLQTLDTLAARLRHEEEGRETARKEHEAAARDLRDALSAARRLHRQALEASRETQERLAKNEAALRARLATGAAWLSTHQHNAALEERLPHLVDSLSHIVTLRRTVRQGSTTLTELAAEETRLAETATSLAGALAVAEKKHQSAGLLLEEKRNALKNLLRNQTVEALLKKNLKLEADLLLMQELRVAMRKREEAVREATELTDRQTTLSVEIEKAEEQRAATEVESHKQAEMLEKAHKMLSLLERISSLEEQRAQLVKGEPCPLCGGRKHPFVEHGREVESKEFLEAKRHIEVARGANETAAKEAQLAVQELARLRAELNLTQKRATAIRNAQMEDYAEFEALARQLRVYTADQLQEAHAAATKARSANNERLAAIAAAEKALNEQALTHSGLEGEVKRLGEAIKANSEATLALAKRLSEAKSAHETAACDLERASLQMAEALAPFKVMLPAEGAEAAAREALENAFRQYQSGLRTHTRLEAELRESCHALEKSAEEHRRLEHEGLGLNDGRAFPPPSDDHEETGGQQPNRFDKEWQVSAAPFATALKELPPLSTRLTSTEATLREREKNRLALGEALARQEEELATLLAATPFPTVAALRAARLDAPALQEAEALEARLNREGEHLTAQAEQLRQQLAALDDAPEGEAFEALTLRLQQLRAEHLQQAEQRARLLKELEDDDALRARLARETQELEAEQSKLAIWLRLRALIGSADGKKFSRFAQGLSLELLVRHANAHLARLNDRYLLHRSSEGDLQLEIIDRHQADAIRPMQSLSGGESFLVSLALALGLSDLAGRNTRIDSLFIDEGFGSLDAETLDTAVAALDALRFNEKTIGVISHVELLKERIPVQIRVARKAGGQSEILLPR